MKLNTIVQGLRVPSVRWSLVALVAVSVIPICVLVVFQVFNYFEQEESMLASVELERARTINQAIDRDIDHLQAILRVFAATLPEHPAASARLHTQALAVMAQMEAHDLMLLDTTGQLLLSTAHAYGTPLPLVASQSWSRQIFAKAQAGVSGLMRSSSPQHPVLHIAVPVLRDGEVLYVLSATVSPRRIERLLTEQDVPPHWQVTLFDAEGEVIARDAEHAQLSGAQVTRGQEAPRLLSISNLSKQTQWALVVGAPFDVLTVNLRKTLWYLFFISVGIIALALVSAWWVGGRISSAFSALLQPAISLARGETISIPPLKIKEADEMRQALLAVSVSAAQNRYAANHDSLTGLPNRVMFDFFLSHQMAACARQKSELSVLFIDLDGFKLINDTHSHAVGDKLLRAVAERMQKNLRTSDMVARMGGDEFVFVLANTDVQQAKVFAERLLDVVSHAYNLDGIEAHVSASIGVAFYASPFDQEVDCQALLNAADKAMYKAKKLGKNQVFVSEMSEMSSVSGDSFACLASR